MSKTFKKFMEDGGAVGGGDGGSMASAAPASVPANNAGQGNIGGIGVGPHGEPGVDPEKERKRRKLKLG